MWLRLRVVPPENSILAGNGRFWHVRDYFRLTHSNAARFFSESVLSRSILAVQ